LRTRRFPKRPPQLLQRASSPGFARPRRQLGRKPAAIINILIDALARQLRRLIFQCRLLPSEFKRPDRLRPLFLAVAPSFALSDLFSDKVAAVRRDQGGVSSTIKRGLSMLGLILLIILILLLLGGLPSWGYSRSWGYGPSGVLGLVLVIVLVLVLLGRI